MGQEIGDRREREVRRVVVVGLNRMEVSTITLGKSSRAIQADVIRVMGPSLNHHPRAVPTQGVVAVLTNLDGDPVAGVAMPVCGDGDGRARVRRAWADA